VGRCWNDSIYSIRSIKKLIADRSPRLKILSILLGEGEEDINKTALNFQGFFIYDSRFLRCKKKTSVTLVVLSMSAFFLF
jgi:hypothetical protein